MKTFEEVHQVVGALRTMDIWEDLFWVAFDDGRVTVSLLCNDLFEWAYSDMEEVEVADIPILRQAYQDLKATNTADDGGNQAYVNLLYPCRKRGMRPQGAYYKHLPEKLHKLFNGCGPIREVNDRNPRPAPDG